MGLEEDRLREKYRVTLPLLDERQKRLVLAADARYLGSGGVSAVSRASGISRVTIHDGLKELKQSSDTPALPEGRVRAAGAGRPRASDTQPGLVSALLAMVDKDSRGDPMSPLRWTCKSTSHLSEVLKQQGFTANPRTVARLLQDNGFSLQANRKTREGLSHPDRDKQFCHINDRASEFLAGGQPVISVDTKKKELVGDFKNGGQEWQPKGDPDQVRVHDFKDPELGKAIPYGVYDVGRNLGWVSVGVDHDTSAFAVETIRRWWNTMGKELYPDADRLLITCDGGGSNGSRTRLWKLELAKLAQETGLSITVSHLPPGTSKWNKIEHRLFSYITMNWRGRPLVSHEAIVNLIAGTTTRKGLKVRAELDTSAYPTEIRVSDFEMKAIRITRDEFHPEWNYTIFGNDFL